MLTFLQYWEKELQENYFSRRMFVERVIEKIHIFYLLVAKLWW